MSDDDDKTIELDVGDAQETEVELASDDQEETGSAPERRAEAESDQSDDSEDNFDKAQNATQKRIDRLTKKMREAERQAEEALRYAQAVQQQKEDLQSKYDGMSNSYVTEYSGRVEKEMQTAESDLARAMDLGDTAAVVDAQRRITRLAIENDRAQQAKIQQERYNQQMEAQRTQQVQNPMPQQQPRRPDPKAEDWAERNSWFGSDEAMTYAAFGIHKRLVEQEQFDPKSDEYYDELDKRMAEEFPHKFAKQNSGDSRRPAQTVAGVSRGNTGRARNGNKVKLNPSQIAIAKKLGVPLEEYAKYVK